jgi:hypothetical protein
LPVCFFLSICQSASPSATPSDRLTRRTSLPPHRPPSPPPLQCLLRGALSDMPPQGPV